MDALDDVLKSCGTPSSVASSATKASTPSLLKKASQTLFPLPWCWIIKGTLGSPGNLQAGDKLDDNQNLLSPVSICPERQMVGQHAMQELVEEHNKHGRKRGAPKSHNPKVTDFRHHCKHFFGGNPDTVHLGTPPEVASHMAHQFFRELKPQGRKKKGAAAVVEICFGKVTQVAKWFNNVSWQDGRPKKASPERLCWRQGQGTASLLLM